MAEFIKGLFEGGAKPSQAPLGDADFADFAAAPSPEAAASPSLAGASPAQQTFGANVPFNQRPFTKWYRVWERVSLSDFYLELSILPFLIFLVALHIWGTAKNKNKVRRWIQAQTLVLTSEFALVGFGKQQKAADDGNDAAASLNADDLFREKSKDLYLSYATGRQNIAFVDLKFQLKKRYNPLLLFGESLVSFFFEGWPIPVDRAEVTAYAFDGKEASLVRNYAESEKTSKTSYEGFVWAVVHKDRMKVLRDERYDLSLTITKENAKLPDWATVMSENAELTDALLTKELVKAIVEVGEDFESLIVTDMPADAPKTLDDLKPRKRLLLTTKLESDPAKTSALLSVFLRIPDNLVSNLKFRPEVLRRVRATREEESKKIRKVEDQEKAEGRKEQADKAKKEDREKKLKAMSADEQRKFLDKEREREQRKSMSRRTIKG